MRAWVIYTLFTIYRIWAFFSGRTQQDWWGEGERIEFKMETVFEILPIVEDVQVAINFTGLAISILCLKWRAMARCFFYIEALGALSLYLVPIGQAQEWIVFILPTFIALNYYCDPRGLVIYLFVVVPVAGLILPTIWSYEPIAERAPRFLLFTLILNVALLTLAVLLTKMTKLQKRIDSQMTEYFNLINRMREGVLVLSQNPLSQIDEIAF